MKKRELIVYFLTFALVLITSNTDLLSHSPVVEANCPKTKSDKIIPKDVIIYLERHRPGFKIAEVKYLEKDYLQGYWNEKYPGCFPGWIKGDFDGNGQIDYVFLLLKIGSNGSLEETRKTIFLSFGDKYKLFDIGWWKNEKKEDIKFSGLNSFMLLVPKGTLITEFEGFDKPGGIRKKILQFPGIEIVNFERNEFVWFWDPEQRDFDVIQTSD